MKLLSIAYSILGFATGFILLLSFLTSLPDGKLHAVFCNVGQGDAIYLRLPDGRDMLIDGGPNEKVIDCLSRHMPFWDRAIDLVFLTHPEHDHLGGLMTVVDRYSVGSMILTSATVFNEAHREFLTTLDKKHIPLRQVTSGSVVKVGSVSFAVLWPSESYMAQKWPHIAQAGTPTVLGAATDLNEGSLVLRVSYGTFSLLLPGDADTSVESDYIRASPLANKPVTVLKIPHHGSKTGISESYVKTLRPSLAILSVGKNSYGHPAPELLTMLANQGIRLLRTDKGNDVVIESDGSRWRVAEE